MDEGFGRYRLKGLLGAGGMGQVYRAYDTELHRDVAIKVLPQEAAADPVFEQRFRREARAAAGLGEPHVVSIYDSGEIDGRLFIAMQLVNGTDLDSLLKQNGPTPPELAVAIVEQAAAALSAAHAAGLVHRDIKPANLLVTPKNFVYLIDFGIARAPGETALTNTGAAIGTLSYMAPERFATGTADHRADIYALACVLHQCLTGSVPYPAVDAQQQMFAHLNGPPPRPSLVRPGVSAAFDAVIAHGMAADPDRRYPSAEALAAAARAALNGSPGGIGPTTWAALPASPSQPTVAARGSGQPVDVPTVTEASKGRPRRTKWAAVLLAAAVVAVVMAMAVIWYRPGADTAATMTGPDNSTGPSSSPTAHPSPRPLYAVASTVHVGNQPMALAVDPGTHVLYSANAGDGTISIIDAVSHSAIPVKVGNRPFAVAVDPDSHIVYVSNADDGSVSVIDPAARLVTATVKVGRSAYGLAVVPRAGAVYVADRDDRTVSVIDIATNAVRATIPIDGAPYNAATDPERQAVYVTNSLEDSLSVIDATSNSVTATIPVGGSPQGVAVDTATHTAYVTNGSDGTVSVVDVAAQTVTATIKVGERPDAVAVDSAAAQAFVIDQSSNTVSVIDTAARSRVSTVKVSFPYGLAVDAGTRTVYASAIGGTVSIIKPTG